MNVSIDEKTLNTLTAKQRAKFDFYQNPDYRHDKQPYIDGTVERSIYVNEIFNLEMGERTRNEH